MLLVIIRSTAVFRKALAEENASLRSQLRVRRGVTKVGRFIAPSQAAAKNRLENEDS